MKIIKLMIILIMFTSGVSQAEDIKCDSKYDSVTEKIIVNVKNVSEAKGYKLKIATPYVWEKISGELELSRPSIDPAINLKAGDSVTLSIKSSESMYDFELLYVQLHTLSSVSEHVDFFCD